MSKGGEPRLALVHDELTRRGGAENVLEELIRLYPSADVYALYAGRPQITVDGKRHPVRTTFLQRFPAWFRRHPSRLLPLVPYAAETLDFSQYDLVISSASGFAKGIVTRAHVPHLCYCHTPARYLWEDTHTAIAQSSPLGRLFGRPLLHTLRLADYAAAQRVDHFIANSRWTHQRIAKTYRRESTVIYPPVDTAFFTPSSSQTSNVKRQMFLCVGRLTPSKKFDQAIVVCEKLALPLVIIGTGHDEHRLRRLIGKHTTLVGKVSREQLRDYYRQARALLQPGEEDFGIAAVEAQSAGCPVIAYGGGGSQETVRDRVTGYLYPDQSPEALAESLRQFIADPDVPRPETLQQHAFRFSTIAFRTAIRVQVEKYLSKPAGKLVG